MAFLVGDDTGVLDDKVDQLGRQLVKHISGRSGTGFYDFGRTHVAAGQQSIDKLPPLIKVRLEFNAPFPAERSLDPHSKAVGLTRY